MARRLVDGMPEARLEVLGEASHLSALEQPRAFEAAVMRFVDSL